MNKKPRTLESFAKADLITLIRRLLWHSDPTSTLIWIEYDRVSAECLAKVAAHLAELKECRFPQDWERYKRLSDKVDALYEKIDRSRKAAGL